MTRRRSNHSKNAIHVEERISSLEAGQEALRDDIHGISKSLSEFSHRTQDAITAISDKISDNSRTPWGILASWAAVIIAVLGLAAAPALEGIVRAEAHTLETTKEVKELREEMHSIRLRLAIHEALSSKKE